MGETPVIEAPLPPAETFPEPSGSGVYPPSQHAGEGLNLEPFDWEHGQLPPLPEFLAADAPPPPEAAAEPPVAGQPEVSLPPAEDESKPAGPVYSAAEGWMFSGRNSQSGELILKRENADFPSGYEVTRVKEGQYVSESPPAAQAEIPSEPQAAEALTPAETPETPPEPQPAPETPVQLTDAEGKIWNDLGPAESPGMHKIISPDGYHTKFITEESYKALKPAAPEDEPALIPAETEPELPATHEEQSNPQEIQELKDRIARLESMLQTKDSPYEIKPGGLVPVYSWAKGYESARIVEEGERNGEAIYKVVTAEGETKTFFKDEVEYWFSHRAEPENAPQSKAEAQKHFSQRFQSVRQELMRLGGKAKDAIAEAAASNVAAAKEALEPTAADIRARANYVAGSAKNAASMTGMMTQVLAEKAGDAGQAAAKAVAGAAKETIVYPWLAGQVVAEKAQEDLPAYRRRLIGRAAGYAAVFSIWLLGPTESRPAETIDAEKKDEADKNHGWNL